MIKLSANETKSSGLLARTRALILIFRFVYLISGPKNHRDFRETGPWAFNWPQQKLHYGCRSPMVGKRGVGGAEG